MLAYNQYWSKRELYLCAGAGRVYANPMGIIDAGGYASEVLGLELRVDGTRLRFEVGGADVPEGEELAAKLRTMVDKLEARHLEAEALAEEMSARAEAEATRADSLATRLAAALAEITRLQHGG